MLHQIRNAKAGVMILLMIFLLANIGPAQVFSQEFYPASPYGGKQQLKEFINEHLVFPHSELVSGKEGNVALAFDIDVNGKPSQLKILQSVSPEINKEAIRLFRLLLWEPASYRGKSVNDHQEITIPFNIKHYHKLTRQRGYDTIPYPYRPVDTSFTTYAYKQTTKVPVPIFSKKDITFQSFMKENFNYPEMAFKQNITGIVNVNFIVEPYGLISNVCTDNRLGAGCTEEAIRLVKLIRWMPGIVNGKAVRVSMNLSITFSLDGKNKFEYQPNQASNSMN
jgi:TonB family protein